MAVWLFSWNNPRRGNHSKNLKGVFVCCVCKDWGTHSYNELYGRIWTTRWLTTQQMLKYVNWSGSLDSKTRTYLHWGDMCMCHITMDILNLGEVLLSHLDQLWPRSLIGELGRALLLWRSCVFIMVSVLLQKTTETSQIRWDEYHVIRRFETFWDLSFPLTTAWFVTKTLYSKTKWPSYRGRILRHISEKAIPKCIMTNNNSKMLNKRNILSLFHSIPRSYNKKLFGDC